MLKISKLDGERNAVALRLDGSLSGVWVGELRHLCEITLANGEKLNIDCGGLSFSDTQGVALMRELRRRQVDLTNCPPLLVFQLEEESAFDAL